MDGKKIGFNLKIIPLTEDGFPLGGLPFIAMFNPSSFAIKEDVNWQGACIAGKDKDDPVYTSTRARSFSLEFTLDGTGVYSNGVKIPVTAQVALFRTATTKIVGETHRPPYLLIQYGTFICNCNITTSTVTYTMFDIYGLPIRAKISASFTERTPGTLASILSMLSSPDLTHTQTIEKPSDILPLMTYKIYKDQNYYLQVAKANKLKNFRKLNVGDTIIFPPIADE